MPSRSLYLVRAIAPLLACFTLAGCIDEALATRPLARTRGSNSFPRQALFQGPDQFSWSHDGVDERVDLPAGLLGSGITELTVVVWIKFDTLTNNDEVFQFKSTTEPPGKNAFLAEIVNTGTGLRFRTHTNTVTNHFTIAVPATATWHMLAFVYDGTQGVANDRVKIYVKTGPGSAVDTAGTHVGAHPTVLNNLDDLHRLGSSFDGNIANLAIFRHGLNQSEVDECHANDKPADILAHSRVADLEFWGRYGDYGGDDPTSRLTDLSGNNVVATPVNFEAGDQVADAP